MAECPHCDGEIAQAYTFLPLKGTVNSISVMAMLDTCLKCECAFSNEGYVLQRGRACPSQTPIY